MRTIAVLGFLLDHNSLFVEGSVVEQIPTALFASDFPADRAIRQSAEEA